MDNMDLTKIMGEYDQIRFTQNKLDYEGYVTEVHENFIKGRFFEKIGSHRVDDWFESIIYLDDFKGLKLEWFFEGQGCDNSAIGCSGSWELLVA